MTPLSDRAVTIQAINRRLPSRRKGRRKHGVQLSLDMSQWVGSHFGMTWNVKVQFRRCKPRWVEVTYSHPFGWEAGHSFGVPERATREDMLLAARAVQNLCEALK